MFKSFESTSNLNRQNLEELNNTYTDLMKNFNIENDFISCDYCKKRGERGKFTGRFCSKICVGRFAQHKFVLSRREKKLNKSQTKLKQSNDSLANSSDFDDKIDNSTLLDNVEEDLVEIKQEFQEEMRPFSDKLNLYNLESNMSQSKNKKILTRTIKSNRSFNENDNKKNNNSQNKIFADSNYCTDEKASKKRACLLTKKTNEFDWSSYLTQTNSKAAPECLFSIRMPTENENNEFKIGMRLEGYDPEHPDLICVLNVAQIQGSRLRLNFDGFDTCYDFWRNVKSTKIFPIGYADENNLKLSPPFRYIENEFNLSEYLSDKQIAPKQLFNPIKKDKLMSEKSFEIGMKLEAVDLHNPIFIRVATVVDADETRVKIKYDGWPSVYDVWIDKDSEDIYPVNWCKNTGHLLCKPSTIQTSRLNGPGCVTVGCNGVGHIKGSKFTTHYSEKGCPYFVKNLNKNILPDRLNVSSIKLNLNESNLKLVQKESDINSTSETIKIEQEEKLDSSVVIKKRGRPPKRKQDTLSKENQEIVKIPAKRGRKPKNQTTDENKIPIEKDLYESVFMSKTNLSNELAEKLALKYNEHLLLDFEKIKKNSYSDVKLWSINEVAKFIQNIPGCDGISNLFKSEEIDGEALLMLQQSDLIKLMKLKLGPAVKIFNYITKLKFDSH